MMWAAKRMKVKHFTECWDGQQASRVSMSFPSLPGHVILLPRVPSQVIQPHIQPTRDISYIHPFLYVLLQFHLLLPLHLQRPTVPGPGHLVFLPAQIPQFDPAGDRLDITGPVITAPLALALELT